ncbi:MAG: tail fiber domain-containing protein [Flavobacteriaceae bacterium]|nr:tail fiber domain-containing protein [Flavobacteriaceae bacterium]
MKTILSLSALLITLTLTAQSNTATWYLNDTSGNGIQSQSSTASGNYSNALGFQTIASGEYSTTLGAGSTASGIASTAMGDETIASGDFSTALGYRTEASGDYSTALGVITTAEDYFSLAIGVHNKTDESPNPNSFSYQNTAFVIGNGGFDSEGNYVGGGYDSQGSYVGNSETFSNAFEVLFDGTTTIAGDLSINSDARLKANIISLGSTLAKLLQIDGKTYTMKKDENKKQKIGVLAQDIEKVFPELVSESNGVKSVNYQGLVPVLINALKEQDSKMKEQDNKMNEQEARIERLEKLLLNS